MTYLIQNYQIFRNLFKITSIKNVRNMIPLWNPNFLAILQEDLVIKVLNCCSMHFGAIVLAVFAVLPTV